MAAEKRRTDSALDRLLFDEAYRYEFYQAVRLLERLAPRRHAVGRTARPADEVVRFRSRLSLAFPPSAIHEIVDAPPGAGPPAMTIAFMGLTGPMGVLPRHYTELLINRARQKDHASQEFLDMFMHRMASLFFRAWEKYRLPVGYERAAASGGIWDDPFSQWLFDQIGLGPRGLRERLEAVDDRSLIFYAGLLAKHPRSASGLEGLLNGYFGVQVKVVQFVGQWLTLSPDDWSRLGRTGPGSTLGSAVLGARVWNQQAKYLLRVGPLPLARFRDFLPTGEAFRAMVQLARLFAGEQFEYDVQPILRAAEVPACRLEGERPEGSRLGWSSWLKTQEFTHDADDLVLAGA